MATLPTIKMAFYLKMTFLNERISMLEDDIYDFEKNAFNRYGKHVFFVMKWLYAGWNFEETQNKDFHIQKLLANMDEQSQKNYRHGGILFSGLPKKSRIIYALYYGDGISIPDLARTFDTTTEKIEKIANNIRKALITEELHLKVIHNFVKYELQAARKSYKNTLAFAEQIIAKYELPDTVATLADKSPAVIDSLNAQLPHVIDNVTNTVKTGVQQVNQIAEFISDGTVVKTVAVGAGSVTAAGVYQVFSAILMALTMPFLWGMSVVFCWKIHGTALVREAPSFAIRRWLTKHLFISFSVIVALPINIVFFAFIFS